MRLSFLQVIFLLLLFMIFFSKNLVIQDKVMSFIKTFIRYLKEKNSIKK